MGKYFIGVDIGTYSSKGVLVSSNGNVIAKHSIEHTLYSPYPGHFEHDAESVWWQEFVTITKSITAASGIAPSEIQGIGTSGIGPCVLPIDTKGLPLRNAILYGIDTRAGREIDQLEHSIGKDAVMEISGSPLSSQSSGPKILWIRNNEPDIYQKSKYFLTCQAYIVYKLTGIPSIDMYSANSYDPLFDARTQTWHNNYVQHVTTMEHLPTPHWSCDIIGHVTKNAAKQTGLAAGTPVITGTIDAAAEAVSAGVVQSGDLLCMFGSSAFFILKCPKLLQSQHFWTANYLEPNTFSFMGGMSTAGSLTTWFRKQFAGTDNYAQLSELAATVPPGADGLIALPYFEGERTPIQDPEACGMFIGLRLRHTKAHMYRALLEGVGYAIRHILETMQAEGITPKRILCAGGGTQNPVWMQLVADITGKELIISNRQIGASYGDAAMAAVGTGAFKNLQEANQWIGIAQSFTPSTAHAAAYNHHYEIFRSLYTANMPLMHKLSAYTKAQHNQ